MRESTYICSAGSNFDRSLIRRAKKSCSYLHYAEIMAKKKRKLLENHAEEKREYKKPKHSREDVSKRYSKKATTTNFSIKTCLGGFKVNWNNEKHWSGFAKTPILAEAIDGCVQWLSHLTIEANQVSIAR